jgi:hypothetical protein
MPLVVASIGKLVGIKEDDFQKLDQLGLYLCLAASPI